MESQEQRGSSTLVVDENSSNGDVLPPQEVRENFRQPDDFDENLDGFPIT